LGVDPDMPELRSTRSEILGAFLAGILVVVFCLLLLWHDPLLFWNDDYELSVLPVMADVARSWSEGHWPLLSPYSWVCSNLAGEFQYGTFSVFVNAAVILIWKFPLSFAQQAAALSITHLFVLAAGAFLLARDCLRNEETTLPQLSQRSAESRFRGGRLSRLVKDSPTALSTFVAVIAALNGWIICWGAIDWFGALAAFAWLPWAWWGLQRALDPQRSRWRFLWPGPFVYLVVTGGFPYTVVMLGLLLCWLSLRTLVQKRNLTSIFPMLVGVALGFGLSAPAWLAIFDYVRGSARELQPSSAHWQWIVPPTALPALILPCWTVKWADFSTRYLPHSGTELACGLVAPAALIAGLISHGRALVRQISWELGLVAVVLLMSMLPTAGMFRWSFRWLPFFHLILAICAVEALRPWPGSMIPATTHSALISPSLLAFLAVALTAIAMALAGTNGPYAFPLTWIFLALSAGWAALDLLSSGTAAFRSPTVGSHEAEGARPGQSTASQELRSPLLHAWIPVFITFAAFLATYLCISPNCGVPKYNLSQELTKPPPLDPQRLYLSIYPPAEYTYRIEKKPGPVGQIVRPGSTSMWAGLHFVNGYSPIRPAGVARYFDFEIHGEFNVHVGEYFLLEKAGPDGELSQLGVDGIAIAREIDTDPRPASEWQLAASNDEGRVFHRRGAPLARVRSVGAIDSRPEEQFAPAIISRIEDSRNRVEINIDVPDIDRPALLTFSRPFFPGYKAWLGDRELPVDSYRGLFPIVELPPGGHGRLVLAYRPWWLVYGGGLSIFCLALVLGAMLVAGIFIRRQEVTAS
jgi:hypothetical protein